MESLVAVKVVVGLDDEAISQAVHDRERLRIWRILPLADRRIVSASFRDVAYSRSPAASRACLFVW